MKWVPAQRMKRAPSSKTSPAGRAAAPPALASAWAPVVETLEGRRFFSSTTIQTLPFVLDFDTDRGEILDKDGQGTGFTRIQANTLGTEYDPSKIDLDTTAGELRITTSGNAGAGGNYNADNSLVNGLETQFDATTAGWSVTVRLKGPLGYLDESSEQGGVMFGPDQDNYVKLVAVAQPTGQFIQFIDEQTTNGTTTHALAASSTANTYTSIGNFANINTLDLRLIGDAGTGKVTAHYSVNGGAFVKIANELTLLGAKKTAFFSSAARAGLIAMHKNDLGPVTVAFDRFAINGGTPVAQRPTVTSTNPANGAVNVPRNAGIAASVNLTTPGAGVDGSTLTTSTVRLYRTSDGVAVAGDRGTSGGGDTITFQPSALLDANTNYTFEVTDGVHDTSGVAFVPYTMTFTTGATGGEIDNTYSFEKVALPTATGHSYTAVKMGPDGKLYAATLEGLIQRFNVAADGTLSSPENITSLQTYMPGETQRFLIGLAFDPASTAQNPILWVTHTQYRLQDGQNWTGKISRLSGTGLSVVQDVVVGLPRSVRDHVTNQLTFGADGKLYFMQASLSAMGAPDNAWGLRAETLLSGAVLRLDTSAYTGTPINAKTAEGGTYNPFAPGAPLTIYATGIRNAYDLLFHSNGHLYVPTNGSAPGGNTPATPAGPYSGTPRIDQGTNGPYVGPDVPALTSVQEVQNDYLFDVLQGGYYGHPNPLRWEFVLGSGDVVGDAWNADVLAYPSNTQPDRNYRGYAYDFGENQSPNGIIEYKSGGAAFGGALDGKILVVRYALGNDVMILTPNASGAITDVKVNIPGLMNFNDPVDLEVNASTGFMYIAEHGGQKLTLVRPITPGANAEVDKAKLVYNDDYTTSGSSPSQTVTLRNTGTGPLSFESVTVGGADASKFTITSKPTLPLTLQPGESAQVSVRFKAGSVRLYDAKLVFGTNDPDTPAIEVKLRGLGTSGEGGSNEPSLQRVLDVHQIPVVVGDSAPLDVFLDNPPTTPNDEVPIERLIKAAPGPVTLEPLAVFGVGQSGIPAMRFGYYTPGNPTDLTDLLTVSSDTEQSVAPSIIGTTSFDPGGAAFGLQVSVPPSPFNNRVIYSEDALNTWDANASNRHKVRFYPLKTSAGVLVPHAYVVAFEEADFTQIDNQDFVAIIRNVQAAPAGPEIGIENLDGAPYTDRLVFSKITNPNGVPTNYSRDTAVLRVRNTGSSALNVTSLSITSSWELLGAPGAPFTIAANGGFIDLTVRFKATTGTIQTGSLTISSNDSDEPTTVIQLAGWRQAQSELPEPTLQQHMELFGYSTVIAKPGQNLANGGVVERIGDEVLSPFWKRADASRPIGVRQLSAYHSMGTVASVNYHTKGNTSVTKLFTHKREDGQTVFPRRDELSAPTYATFNHTGTFGFRVDTIDPTDPAAMFLYEWSDPTRNDAFGDGGHHIRFFVAKDRGGNVIPDTYLMVLDYAAINYDYQDDVYLLTNVKPESPPAAPSGLTAASIGTGIDVNWADSTEANLRGYNIYRADDLAGPFTKLNSVPLTHSEYTDLATPVGATRYYRVTAVDLSANESAPSATVSATRLSDTTPPVAPTGLTAAGNLGGITLDWNNNTDTDLAGYNIYRSTAANGTFTKINASLLTSSDYIDTTAPQGQTSFYRVAAVDTSGNESAAATTNAARPGDSTAPAQPTGLLATGSSSGVALDWNNNTEADLAGYNVYRSTSQFGTYDKLNTSGLLTASDFVDAGAPIGQTSWYRVTAVDANGNESFAAETSAARPGDTTAPAQPTGLTLVASLSGILLDWSNNTEGDLAGYDVFRSDALDGTYTKLNTSGLHANSTFDDTTAPAGQVSYYRIVAVDTSNNASTPATGNATRPSPDTTAPAQPTGLIATGGFTGIALNWSDNTDTDLAGYNVYRAPTSGGVFTKVNTGGLLTTSDYLDTSAPGGQESYYRVTAVDTSGNESTPATANAPRPVAYTGANVGSPSLAGSHTVINEGFDYDVRGAGANINGTSDQFYFLYRQLTGNFDVKGRLEGLTNTDPSAKAGLMARESLAGNSANAYLHGTPTNGDRFSYRATAGATTNIVSATSSPTYPNNWLRLQRVGNTFNAYVSNDGTNWTLFRSQNVTMSSTLYVGMAVTSKKTTQLATGTFRSLGELQSDTAPATPSGLSATGSAGGVVLDWNNNAESDLAGYDVYRSDTPNGTYVKLNASLLTSSDFNDTTGPINATSYYRIYAVDTAGNASAPATISGVRSSDTVPPTQPTGLVATGSASGVALDWADNSDGDLAGYNVYRSDSPAGTFVKLNSSLLLDSSYIDAAAPGGTSYYRVVAVDLATNESAPATANATRPVTTYSGVDIGSPTRAGSTVTVTPGVAYDVKGSGENIQGAADQFHFAQRQITGDFDIRVRLTSLTNTNSFAKAGLMARESLAAGASNAYVFGTPGNTYGARMSHRQTTDGFSSTLGTGMVSYPNTWLRLKRVGDTFTGYISTDGVNWTQLGQTTIAMGPTVYFGMAVTSKNTNTTATAKFDNLSDVV